MKHININTLPETGTSHDENIKKKVFIQNGEIPNLMMFGSAVFKPGQKVDAHKHDSMIEVFYIQSGNAEFTVNNHTFIATPGDCITVEVGEEHAQFNPFDEDVVLLYFGIATK